MLAGHLHADMGDHLVLVTDVEDPAATLEARIDDAVVGAVALAIGAHVGVQ